MHWWKSKPLAERRILKKVVLNVYYTGIEVRKAVEVDETVFL